MPESRFLPNTAHGADRSPGRWRNMATFSLKTTPETDLRRHKSCQKGSTITSFNQCDSEVNHKIIKQKLNQVTAGKSTGGYPDGAYPWWPSWCCSAEEAAAAAPLHPGTPTARFCKNHKPICKSQKWKESINPPFSSKTFNGFFF